MRRAVEIGLLLSLAVIDLRSRRLPNSIIVAGVLFTLAVVTTLYPPSLRALLAGAPGAVLAAVPGVGGDPAAVLPALQALVAAAWNVAPQLWSALLGGAVGGLLFVALYLLARGGLGAGDVKLAGYIGLVLGFPDVLRGLFYGVVLGGVVSLLLLVTRRVRRDSRLAYGPYLVGGAIVALVTLPPP